MNPLILIFIVLALLVPLLLKKPEIALGLYTYAYVLKGGENFGPYNIINLTMILLVIAFIGFVFPFLISKKKVIFKILPSDMLLLLFVGVLLFWCVLTASPRLGFQDTLIFISTACMPYFIVRIFMTDYAKIKNYILTIISLSIFVGVLVIFIPQEYLRASFLGANPIPTGLLISVGLLILLISLIENNFFKIDSKFLKLLLFAVLPLLLYSLFFNGSRGPGIAAFVAFTGYFFVLFKNKPKKALKLSFFIFLLIGIILLSSITLPNVSNFKLLTNKHECSYEDIAVNSYCARVYSYSKSIGFFTKHPLFGLGTSGFIIAEGGAYAHNLFLEIASDLGIIGLSIFSLFLFMILLNAHRFMIYSKKLKGQDQTLGYIVIFVSLLIFVETQFSFIFYYMKDMFIFFALIINLSLLSYKEET